MKTIILCSFVLSGCTSMQVGQFAGMLLQAKLNSPNRVNTMQYANAPDSLDQLNKLNNLNQQGINTYNSQNKWLQQQTTNYNNMVEQQQIQQIILDGESQ